VRAESGRARGQSCGRCPRADGGGRWFRLVERVETACAHGDRCHAPSFEFYDASDIALLVASAREDERVLILFAAHTGARAGEQLALESSDIDFRQKSAAHAPTG
jgi:integrase